VARTGRFGRLPRTAPNLTSVIIAIIREAAAQQDQNIVNAWEDGSEYEGKPVTDQMLLEHITKRRNALSPEDPEWDRWNVMLDTYSFSIEESKMSLRYAQHGVNETQMATFYTEWAGKLPVDSEAYRNLMRSAAQFLDAAKARAEQEARAGGGGGGGGSRSSRGSQANYDAEAMGVYEANERGYDVATDIMLQAAYRAGILQITDTADPDDLADLRGGDEADHARFLNLFDQINTDPDYADIKQALADEGLGDLTYGTYITLGDAKAAGIEQRIGLAYAYDDVSGAEDLQDDLTEYNVQRLLVNDIDETAAYQHLRRAFDVSMDRPGMTPWEVRDAYTRYRNGLDALDASAASDQTRGFLNNERRALRGEQDTEMGTGPTLYEGNEGGQRTAEGSDSGGIATLVRETESRIQAVETGGAYLTAFIDPDSGLQAYDIIPRGTPGLGDQGLGMVVWTSVGPGRSVPTYVAFTPIYAQGTAGRDPRTGRAQVEVAASSDQLVGQFYVLNGKRYYGVYTEGAVGDLTWFADDPFTVGEQDRTISNDGSLVLRFTLPEGEDPALGFDPGRVIDPIALDMELPRSTRFDNPDEALYYTDPRAQRALLQTPDREAARVIAELYGDGEEAAAHWDNFREMRNTAVGLNNRSFNAIQMENARLGLGPDPDMPARGTGMQRFERTGLSPAEQEREDAAERARPAFEAWERERARTFIRLSGVTAPAPGDYLGLRRPVRGTELVSQPAPVAIRLPSLSTDMVPGLGVRPIDEGSMAYRPGGVKPVKRAAPMARPRGIPPVSQPVSASAPAPLATPRPVAPLTTPRVVTPTSPTMLDSEDDEPTIRTPTPTSPTRSTTLRTPTAPRVY